MNNFAALFAFNAAFQSSQVFRLKSTLKVRYRSSGRVMTSNYILQEFSPKRKQVLDDIAQVTSTNRGYKNYREKLRLVDPPCVPFVGKTYCTCY